MIISKIAVTLPLIALYGCASLPKISSVGLEPSVVVNKIYCELQKSVSDPDYGRLKKEHWVAVAQLSLEGDDSIGLTPNLSYVNPLAAAMTTFVFSANAMLSRMRQQIFSLNVNFDLASLAEKGCKERNQGDYLAGDLGLDEIIGKGLHSLDGAPGEGFPDQQDTDSFGSTIKFVISKGVGGGPQWTLTHFVGPSADGGLVNATAMDVQQLIISFSPAKDPQGKFRAPSWVPAEVQSHEAIAGAILRAQSNNALLLLQSLRRFP